MLRGLAGRPETRVVLTMILQSGTAMLLALLSARWLGPADRGIVVIITFLGSILMLVGSLGTATGARVLVGREDGTRLTPRRVLRSTRPLLLAHVGTATVAGSLTLWLVDGHVDWGVCALFAVYACSMLWAYLRRELLHGLGRHQEAVRGEVCSVIIQLGLVAAAHLAGHLNVYVAVAAMAVGILAQVAYQTPYLFPGELDAAEHERGDLRSLVGFSVPALATTVGQEYTLRADRLFLGVAIGSASAGVYGSAASLAETLTLLAAGASQILFRQAARGLTLGHLLKCHAVVGCATALGAATLWITGPTLIDITLGEEYHSAVGPLRILAIGAIPFAVYQLNVAVINGAGNLGRAARLAGAGALTLTVACFVLIPLVGANGAAWASVMSYSVLAVGSFAALPSLQHKLIRP